MPIDNALEKIKQGVTDDGDNLFDGLVQAGAVFSPIFATFGVARAVVNSADAKHRMLTAISCSRG